MRRVPDTAVKFVGEHEELVLRVYDDQQPKKRLTANTRILGTLTAGYGHIGALVPAQKVTKADADQWLREDLQEAAELIEKRIGEVVNDLTENQYAALLSFVFNLGANPNWNIWRRLKKREYDQIPLEMQKFVYITQGGQKVKLQGLVNRRGDEVKLWSTEEPGSEPITLPSSMTRNVLITPPASADPKPVHATGRIIAAAASSVAAAPVAINQVAAAIQPYSENSDYVQQVMGVLATVAAACGVLALVLMWLHKRNSQT